MDTDDILDRVSKLLAKAKSTTNEHEAAIFADKAAELLAKHNLDEAMLRARDSDREEGPIGVHPYQGRSPDRWREANAKVAMLMADYLIATTKRLAREHSPHKLDQDDFRRGCGLGLYNRMIAMHAEKATPASGPTGTNLPALYNSEAQAISEWMATVLNVGKARKSRGMRIGAAGAAGREAAGRISLNTQVTERRSSRLLA